MVLYAPVVHDKEFLYAVSYLVRRMDENTGSDNFLTHSFNLKPGTETWKFLQKQFEDAYAIKDKASTTLLSVRKIAASLTFPFRRPM